MALFKKGDHVRAIRNGAVGYDYKQGDTAIVMEVHIGALDVTLNRGGVFWKGVSINNWELVSERSTERGAKVVTTMREIKKDVFEHFAWDNMPERWKDFRVVMKNGHIDSFILFGNHLWEDDVRALSTVFADVINFIDDKKEEKRQTDEKTKPMRRIETEE